VWGGTESVQYASKILITKLLVLLLDLLLALLLSLLGALTPSPLSPFDPLPVSFPLPPFLPLSILLTRPLPLSHPTFTRTHHCRVTPSFAWRGSGNGFRTCTITATRGTRISHTQHSRAATEGHYPAHSALILGLSPTLSRRRRWR